MATDSDDFPIVFIRLVESEEHQWTTLEKLTNRCHCQEMVPKSDGEYEVPRCTTSPG